MGISMSSTSPVAFKSRVELKCVNKMSDTGVYWFLQKKNYTTRFILYISIRSKITPEDITDYQASKNGDYYQLTIRSFEEKHQGVYYCVSHRNQILHFSSGLQVYVPESTTRPPPVTTQVPTLSKGQDMECQDHTIHGLSMKPMESTHCHARACNRTGDF
ncbi:hypothetical protein JRQ81_004816 [Phrynocephalus forsythii]|uniref:Immunoglobulin domain-containing protein n=1 Tax=Phrynocephalus forsythii TaxID=171643 RepID=A0A9Q0XFP4_9SAUR|nr:hypothetical protein JRQ81_004816 [Phrynocephalus forsythii]